MNQKYLSMLCVACGAALTGVSCRSEIPVYKPPGGRVASALSTASSAVPASLNGAWIHFRHKVPFSGADAWFYVWKGICFQLDDSPTSYPPRAPKRMDIDLRHRGHPRCDDEQGRSWLKTDMTYKVQGGVAMLSLSSAEGQYFFTYDKGDSRNTPAKLELKKVRTGVYEGLYYGSYYYMMSGGRVDPPTVHTIKSPIPVTIYTR